MKRRRTQAPRAPSLGRQWQEHREALASGDEKALATERKRRLIKRMLGES